MNDAPIDKGGSYVLYWMSAQRRTHSNFALQHAMHQARRLGKPLLVLEALRVDYPWASERLHRFVLDGMAVNAARCEEAGLRYMAYVEPSPGRAEGLLEALAERACLVVTDEFPAYFLPRMVSAAGRSMHSRLEQVDGNGLLPLRATERAYPSAYAFRRFLQRELPGHLRSMPDPDPLRHAASLKRAVIPRRVLEQWPMMSAGMLQNSAQHPLDSLPIDHGVKAVARTGGSAAAEERLTDFLQARLDHYGQRNQPESDVSSGLAPYLHFGHVSSHQVLAELSEGEDWSCEQLSAGGNGKREGWWGMSPAAEAFLDQLVTWRELGYGFAYHRPKDYQSFDSLPDWAKASLLAHASDRREHRYELADFEAAQTHDRLWNAAQTQLLQEGVIHNYLRMLWGKKILEWSASPEEALEIMIELNNKYALDGRDPNSYSGIFWTLGRFDRPWAPERPIFGVVRYMSSANTARKLRVKGYIKEKLESEENSVSSTDASDQLSLQSR
ncbi:MAG: deoxyribodipyrimidine photolyase [Planctomycetota bacterium]